MTLTTRMTTTRGCWRRCSPRERRGGLGCCVGQCWGMGQGSGVAGDCTFVEVAVTRRAAAAEVAAATLQEVCVHCTRPVRTAANHVRTHDF